ncbi:hypothetical protein RDABS01_033246 [Bienertia sinuspersici]
MDTKETTENTSSSINSSWSCLPEDLILEILKRLPVKSLIRFKSVCKDWKSIINDPNFGKSKQTHSKTSEYLSSSYIILRSDNSMFTLNLDLNNLAGRKNRERKGYNILCSFNGVLCVHICDTENIFMWNPITDEARLIPSPSGMDLTRIRLIGFGYTFIKLAKLKLSRDMNHDFGVAIKDRHNLFIYDMQNNRSKPDVVEVRENGMILENDHTLLATTGHGRVLIFEKRFGKINWLNDEGIRMEKLLVFDASQGKRFFIEVNNEYCVPYKSGETVYQVVNYVPSLLSPKSL